MEIAIVSAVCYATCVFVYLYVCPSIRFGIWTLAPAYQETAVGAAHVRNANECSKPSILAVAHISLPSVQGHVLFGVFCGRAV